MNVPLRLQEVTPPWQADPPCSVTCRGYSGPQKNLGPPLPHPPHPRHHRQFQVAICFQSLSSQAQASATVPTQILGNTCQLFQMFLLKHHPLTQSASRGTPRLSKGILIA